MAKDVEQMQNMPEEEGSSFDIKEWIFRILHYWYLFIIGLVIAYGLSMVENRKWKASYYSAGTLIIKEYGSYAGSQALMSGFGVDAGYKNVNNQVIMLSSYDLMGRVVDSLPDLRVEYITKGHFRTTNHYNDSPIYIEPLEIASYAYGTLYAIDTYSDGTFKISSTSDNNDFSVTGRYWEPVETDQFKIIVSPTGRASNSSFFIRFRDRNSLINEFMSRLSLSFVTEGSSVLQLGLASETPARDCDFINKLCEIYLLQNLERKNAVADNSLRFINDQLDVLKDQLETSEGKMTDFRQENQFVDVSAYASNLMSKMETFDSQEMTLKLKETYLNYLDNYLQTNMEAGAIIAPSSLGLNETMLMTLVTQLNDLTLQRAELSEKNVYYAKYTNDINNVKNAINEVVKSMRASLEIEKQDLKERAQGVEKDIMNLPEKELRMVEIERNYRIDDNYYTFFLQKRAEAEIQRASNTPDNDILDKARTLSVTNAGTRKKTTTKYLAIGLIIPFIIVVLSELLNKQIRNPKEAEKLSPFSLIGSVRHAKSQNPTLVVASPRSSYAEMLRGIRMRLEFIAQRKTKLMLTVTSTQSGDGKTFFSTNLAALYGMTGKKTILVDLDIRKPNIHEKLGLDNGLGVTNYLIGDCELSDIILTDTPFQFDVVRAGTIPPNPGELIRSDKLTALLDYIRENYDFAIFDTSPVGLVPDAYSLIEQTDATLFIIRCMQTDKSFCKSTLEQLALEHKDKVHLVLSDIPTEGRRYGYYSGGYGYGYGGYGYGYGYGSSKGRYGKYGKMFGRYGKYGRSYGKYGYGYGLFGKKQNDSYNYYGDEEEVDDSKKK